MVLSFRIPKESRLSVDEVLNLQGDLTLEVTKYRKNRSLDANAYMWVLCDKIARKLITTKEEIYRNIIRKVGVFDCVTVRSKAADSIVTAWESRGTGWIADTISETNDCAIIALYYGSSCYNTAEFSRLLDEIISDAMAKNYGRKEFYISCFEQAMILNQKDKVKFFADQVITINAHTDESTRNTA